MEEQLLGVRGVETCVCFASPAELLGEVVGVACVPATGAPPPSLAALAAGLPGTPPRFRPRVLVLLDQIPKGPTGKPKRIGLAQMLGIPALPASQPGVTYRAAGTGAQLGPLERLTSSGARVPVWRFPLTISLDVSPDLGEEDRSTHTLVIADSRCLEARCTVTAYASGQPIAVEWPIEPEAVRETLECIERLTEQRGLSWQATVGARGRREDWCGQVVVADGERRLSHYWPAGCSDPPPGKLMRLLRVLELGQERERALLTMGPHDALTSPWHMRAVEQGLVPGLKDKAPTDATPTDVSDETSSVDSLTVQSIQ